MRNLGKLVLLLIVGNISLFGAVKASLDTNEVYSGEMVNYRLTMSGEDITKPAITQICSNKIVGTSSQTSIESINGSYSKTYTLSYQFMPTKSCTIAPTEVKIGNKTYKSNAVELRVKEPTQDKNAPFVLTLKSSKNSLYVGEPFELTLTLKQSLDAQAVDSKFIAPAFEGVWLKSQSKPVKSENQDAITTTVVYTLAAQREGNLSIEPAQLRVASRVSSVNSWGTFAPQVKWRNYYSNKPTLEIKPIPNNATLIGDFSIAVELSKREINPNEAVNVNVIVEGVGNLEDIKSFKPFVENVNVFDEKIVIQGDKLTQKLAFVSDENFTIPAFELVFFNTKTQKVQKITSEAIDIKVNGEAVKKELNIYRDIAAKETSINQETAQEKRLNVESEKTTLAVVFLLGLILGVALMLVKPFVFKKREKSLDIKNEKLLLVKFLPYKDDGDVARVMHQLEKNIYSKEKIDIDKKLLKELLKRHNIS